MYTTQYIQLHSWTLPTQSTNLLKIPQNFNILCQFRGTRSLLRKAFFPNPPENYHPLNVSPKSVCYSLPASPPPPPSAQICKTPRIFPRIQVRHGAPHWEHGTERPKTTESTVWQKQLTPAVAAAWFCHQIPIRWGGALLFSVWCSFSNLLICITDPIQK